MTWLLNHVKQCTMKRILILATFALLNSQFASANVDAVIDVAESKIRNCINAVLQEANSTIRITREIDKNHISKHFFATNQNDKTDKLNMVEYFGQENTTIVGSKFTGSHKQKRQELYMMLSICKAMADYDSFKIITLKDDRIGVLLKPNCPFPMTKSRPVDNMLFVLSNSAIITIYCTEKNYSDSPRLQINNLMPFISISSFISKLTCKEENVKVGINKPIAYENRFLPLSFEQEDNESELQEQIHQEECIDAPHNNEEQTDESCDPKEQITIVNKKSSKPKQAQSICFYLYDCANFKKSYSSNHLAMLYKNTKQTINDIENFTTHIEASLLYIDILVDCVANSQPSEDKKATNKKIIEIALNAVLDLLIISKQDINQNESEDIFIKRILCLRINYNRNLLTLAFVLYLDSFPKLTEYLINYVDCKCLENCSRHCLVIATTIDDARQQIASLEALEKSDSDITSTIAQNKEAISKNSSRLLSHMQYLFNLFKYVETRIVAISLLDNDGINHGGKFLTKFYFETKAIMELLNPKFPYLPFFQKSISTAISLGDKNAKIDKALNKELAELVYKRELRVRKV